jgi:uncharacterized protein YcaQ
MTQSIPGSAVCWFRLCRSGLVEPFASAPETARRLVGVQAQLPAAAALAVFQRTRGCTLESLHQERLRRRTLVRFWGQRNTVHLYAAGDWPLLHAAFGDRSSVLERRLKTLGLDGEFRRLRSCIRKRLEQGEQLSHKDVRSPKLEEGQDQFRVSYITFMSLVQEGIVCHGQEEGSETRFVHRKHWLPGLAWDPPPKTEALAEITRRYLAAYGPARPHDVAFWFGANVSAARSWMESLGEECAEVSLDGEPHWCLTSDLPILRKKPPAASRWPTCLLPRFDPLLLATKDKSWLIDTAHYRKVWRPSAQVEAVMLVSGRIAGTWRYQRRARTLKVALKPFASLAAPAQKKLSQDAERIAEFLGLESADVKAG